MRNTIKDRYALIVKKKKANSKYYNTKNDTK